MVLLPTNQVKRKDSYYEILYKQKHHSYIKSKASHIMLCNVLELLNSLQKEEVVLNRRSRIALLAQLKQAMINAQDMKPKLTDPWIIKQ